LTVIFRDDLDNRRPSGAESVNPGLIGIVDEVALRGCVHPKLLVGFFWGVFHSFSIIHNLQDSSQTLFLMVVWNNFSFSRINWLKRRSSDLQFFYRICVVPSSCNRDHCNADYSRGQMLTIIKEWKLNNLYNWHLCFSPSLPVF